jgi:hypothetical protein
MSRNIFCSKKLRFMVIPLRLIHPISTLAESMLGFQFMCGARYTGGCRISRRLELEQQENEATA